MKKVLFIGILAYICAISLCQDYQETEQLASVTTEAIKPSMINMISKYIELNGQIDDVLKSSTTETYVKSSGICETEETYIEEVTVTERIPHQVEVRKKLLFYEAPSAISKASQIIFADNFQTQSATDFVIIHSGWSLVLVHTMHRTWDSLSRGAAPAERNKNQVSTVVLQLMCKFFIPKLNRQLNSFIEKCYNVVKTMKWSWRQMNVSRFVMFHVRIMEHVWRPIHANVNLATKDKIVKLVNGMENVFYIAYVEDNFSAPINFVHPLKKNIFFL